MKKLSRVFKKYGNPILLIAFAIPIFMLIILNAFVYEAIDKSIITIFIAYTCMALLFGRVYCGYICQFGMIQRFFNIIGELLLNKPLEIPKKLDRHMRVFKYVFALVLLVWSLFKMKILVHDFPFSQYSRLWDELGFIEGMLDWTIGILIISAIIGSIMVKSFYCKYFCIKGSVFGLLSKISAFCLKVDKNKCTGCKLCTINCPMNIKVHSQETVKSMDCMRCQQCVAICPKKAVNNTFLKVTVSPAVLMPASVGVFILLLLTTSYLL